MNILEAIFLGIIQGATEFLPISSSGHLLVIPALLRMAEPNLNVIAIAHTGTLAAVLIYFWRDLWQILVGVLQGLRQRQPTRSVEARIGWYILVGSIPAGVAGLLLEDYFDDTLGRPGMAAAFLLVTAALLLLGERLISGRKPLAQMSWLDAVLIGLAQMLALLPGISRSGSTITMGLLRGLDRATAARYSFLLGVPAIGGAGLLSVFDLLAAPDLASQLPGLVATFLTSAVVGYACIHFLLQWLRQRRLHLFAAYCIAVSLLYFVVSLIR